jgi:hypothetical protein
MWMPRTCAALVLAMLPPAQVFTAGHIEQQARKPSPAQQKALLSAVQNATGEHSPNLLEDFSVFAGQLAETGPPAIFATSENFGCGVHPNCIFLVFRPESGNDVPILNTVPGAYDLLSSRHSGYRDLVLQNYQGIHTMVSVWRYDGRQYRIYACTDETSEGTQNRVPIDRCG